MTVTQMTISLPTELVKRTERLTKITRRNVSELMTDALELSLPSLEANLSGPPVQTLSDDEVLELTQLRMAQERSARLSVLLEHQQADTLTQSEADELEELMRTYESGLVRQSEALAEAVKRGLREPLA